MAQYQIAQKYADEENRLTNLVSTVESLVQDYYNQQTSNQRTVEEALKQE